MKTIYPTAALLLAAVLAIGAAILPPDPPSTSGQTITDELDAYWAVLSKTVAEGDFEGYAATYHDDAVIVMLTSGAAVPIADALAGWKQGFEDTAAGRMSAGVDFRFSQRLNSETAAHETGIFRYHYQPEGQDEVALLVHFEGLLVKKDGEWLMTMEYQKEYATQAEWDALAE